MRLEDTPEWAGPQGESGFGTGQGNQAGAPGAGRPARDPAAEAIERTIEAERRADQFRSAPADATVVT